MAMLLFSVAGVFLLAGIYLVVDAGQKSDHDRAKMGLGPKGQGR